MKFDKSSDPSTVAPPGESPAASAAPVVAADLGLIERRHGVRPLPAPEAVESDGDSAWATFQSLISDEPKNET